MKTDMVSSTFKLPKHLRDEFAALCREHDVSYSQGLRHLMNRALKAAQENAAKPPVGPQFEERK